MCKSIGGLQSTAVSVLALLILLILLILLVILILLIVLVLVLIIHSNSPPFLLRHDRCIRMPGLFRFILRLENKAGKETGKDCSGNSSCGSFQTTCKYPQYTVAIYRLFDTVC